MDLGRPARHLGASSRVVSDGHLLQMGQQRLKGPGPEHLDLQQHKRHVGPAAVPQAQLPSTVKRVAVWFARWTRMLQTGAFVNHMWGEAGTKLGIFQMWMIKLLMIWPCRAIAPVAYLYWGWRLSERMRGRRPFWVPWPKEPWPLAKAVVAWAGREVLQGWLGLEVLFYVYYRYEHWKLERRVASAPLLPPSQTMPELKRSLATVEMIQKGGKIAEPRLSISSSFPALSSLSEPSLKDRNDRGAFRHKPSVKDFQEMLKPKQTNESGIEDLLRDWNHVRSIGDGLDIMPKVSTDMERAAVETMVDDAELLTLKQAEACGWFVRMPYRDERWPTNRLREIRRGNVLEWVAWAFLNTELDRVPKDRMQEVESMADEIEQWAEVSLQPGYNPDVKAMRLTIDPIPSRHRPLLYYIVTQGIFGLVIDIQLQNMGFEKHFSGTLQYWHRQNDPSGQDPLVEVPIVFCHGLGVNLMPYRPLIDEMLRKMPGRSFFLISLPHISMRISDSVPSAGELVASLSDMLASWGYEAAHFVGHSFGSLPLAWMAKKAPQCIRMLTFLDPICFLLIKPDVCYNFVYRKPADPTQLLINYFISKELYIAHALSRNFFWHQNLLWPEELPAPTLVMLCGRDSVVPAHSVRRYLAAFKQKNNVKDLRLLWFPDLGHGEMNFGGVGEAATVRLVEEMMRMEAECEPGPLLQSKALLPPPSLSAPAVVPAGQQDRSFGPRSPESGQMEAGADGENDNEHEHGSLVGSRRRRAVPSRK